MSVFAKSAARMTARAIMMPMAPRGVAATRAGAMRISRAALRPISTGNHLNKKTEVVKEAEVPVSVYTPDAKGVPAADADRFTLHVNPQEEPEVIIDEKVVPLKEDVYNSMPRTMQKMSVMGKTVIVTGGARGLGNHMAKALAEAGAKSIALLDVSQENGDAAAEELSKKAGIPVSFFKVDVRDQSAVNTAVESVVQMFGVPDVVVNSAGIADSNMPAETYDLSKFRRLIDINLNGSFLVAQAVGRTMIAANRPGSIILVASMSGSIVNYPQEQSCYNASKAGVIQLSKSLAAEWAKYNIRVNSISPGYMDTALNRVPALDAQKQIWKGLTPQARLGAVDDLNGLCVFLASDASGFMTGSDVIIDGGYTLY